MSFGYIAVGVIGAGIVVNHMARKEAGEAEAAMEQQNAAYYREQAQFAKEAGERAQNIFDRESIILFSTQKSQLAAADVGMEVSTGFMEGQYQARREERIAIGKDTEANVRLAMLRGGMSDQRAAFATDSRMQNLALAGDVLGAAGTFLGGSMRGGGGTVTET